MQRRGRLGPPVAKRNRQIMKDKIASLTHQNASLLSQNADLLNEKADWITEKADLEFQISDYRQANKGLAQTIKDMNDLHFEWRERLEEKYKKKIHKLNFLVRN